MTELSYVEVVKWKIAEVSKYVYVKCSDILEFCMKYGLPTSKPLPRLARIVDDEQRLASTKGLSVKNEDGKDGWIQFVEIHWYLDKFGRKCCSKCNEVKTIDLFPRGRAECSDCRKGGTTEKDEAGIDTFCEFNNPCGTLATPQHIINAQWTYFKGDDANKWKYVKSSDLSDKLLNSVTGANYQKGNIVDEETRTAKATPSGKHAFIPVWWCLKMLLGVAKCNKCPEDNNIHPIAQFDVADSSTGRLRTDCKKCKKAISQPKYEDRKVERAAAIEAGLTFTCVKCGDESEYTSLEVKRFGSQNPKCTRCNNAEQVERGQQKAEVNPEQFKFCAGSGTAKPLDAFDEGKQTSRVKLESGRKYDAKEDRKQSQREKQQAIKTNVLQSIKDKKRSAAKRGKEWDLEDEFVENLLTSPCYYSGIYEPEVHLMGIDRVNNDIGYTAENCVPCHGHVNFMKKDMNIETFIQACKEAANEGSKRALLMSRYTTANNNNQKCPLDFDSLCLAIVNTMSSKPDC